MTLLLLAACRGEQVSVSTDDNAQADSLALHVAVMPVADCLPICYAQEKRLFAKQGLDVRLQLFASQMDADTALLYGHVELAYTDLARLLEMQGDSLPLRAVAAMDGRLSLLTTRKKRIRRLQDLNERMIALDRLSTSDYWSDEIMKQAGMERTAIYRPQINDVQLRRKMLHDQLVDGALLPEPYATQAERQGHRRIFSTPDSAVIFNCLATRANVLNVSRQRDQLQDFFRIYNQAVAELNHKPDEALLRTIWLRDYQLPASLADSMPPLSYPKARSPKDADADAALQWLLARERTLNRRQRDSLLSKLPLDH